MDGQSQPIYACPYCGATEYCAESDAYSIYRAEGDSLRFQRAELTNDGMRLHCRECGGEAPKEFADAAA